jgi:hypothetical protein
MAARVRDHCRAALALAVDERNLKPYLENGPYAAPRGRDRFALDERAGILVHYADCRGPLYRDDANWKRAYDVVRSFTRGVDDAFDYPWTVDGLGGLFRGVGPAALLDAAETTMLALGFERTARSDAAAAAYFTLHDSCRTTDLPEPYGKWQQHVRRVPRWDQNVSLELSVSCTVAVVGRDARGDLELALSVGLSSLAPSVPLGLAAGLGRLLLRDDLLETRSGPLHDLVRVAFAVRIAGL